MRRLHALQFTALVLTALALVPVGAHLAELANKIGLAREQYFVVQRIYSGWALFGVVIIAAICANLALAVLLLFRGAVFWPSLAAGLILGATLIVFFIWTYPTNVATANWTMIPTDWQALRAQWETSHAANAVLTFIALCCAAWSAIEMR